MSKVTGIKTLEKKVTSAIPTQTGGEIAVLLDADAGKFNTLYTITSLTEFDKVFGVVDSTTKFKDGYTKQNYYDWCRYLISRGNVLRIVRAGVDTTGINKASLTVEASVSLSIVFDAIGFGRYYNNIAVKFSQVGTSKYFACTISYNPSNNVDTVIETYPVVSLDSTDSYFIGNIVSDVVKVTVNGVYTDEVLTETENGKLSGATDTVLDASNIVTTETYTWNYAAAYGALTNFSDREYTFQTLLTFCAVGSEGSNVKRYIENLLDARGYDFVYLDSENIIPSSDNVGKYEPKVKVSKIAYFVPAALAVADTCAYLYRSNLIYKAPAGIPYGVLTDVIDVEKVLTSAEIAAYQTASINPIVVKQGTGIVIWGDATLTTSPLDLGRMSLRLLVDYFKQTVYARSQRFIFMDNIPLTWNEWVNEVEPIVRDIYNIGALINYRVVCDESIMTEADIANGIMRGAIYIQPPYKINEIEITFTVDESGVSFE